MFPNTEVEGVQARSGVTVTLTAVSFGSTTHEVSRVVWSKAQRNLFSKYAKLRRTAMAEISDALQKLVEELYEELEA